MNNNNLPRILIVEDDQTFRETVCEVLRDAGYKVRGARSLNKATKRLTHHTFDLVVSDLELGKHSGFEVLEVANKTHPNAKIMLMSGSGDPELVQQALDSGAKRFLSKPFRVKELLRFVEELLESANKDEEKAEKDKKQDNEK